MKKIAILFICLAIIFSCKKDSKPVETTTTNSGTEVIKGNITGSTVQYNQYGEELKTGLNSVTVSLDNDNVTAITDEAGKYTLIGVKPGIYVISLSKPGCTTFKIQQVNFPGNGTLNQSPRQIVETPTFSFQSATANWEKDSTFKNKLNLKINLNLNSNSKEIWAAIITGTTSNIDIMKTNDIVRTFKIPANKTTYSFYYNASISDTSNLYVKIYTSAGLYEAYRDVQDNNLVYSGIGAGLPAVKVK